MKEVLQKIYLESEGASARAEVRSEPMPSEDPISVGASVVDMDESEAPPEALAAANLDERLSRAEQRSAELLRSKRKKGAVRGSEQRELTKKQRNDIVGDSLNELMTSLGDYPTQKT